MLDKVNEAFAIETFLHAYRGIVSSKTYLKISIRLKIWSPPLHSAILPPSTDQMYQIQNLLRVDMYIPFLETSDME